MQLKQHRAVVLIFAVAIVACAVAACNEMSNPEDVPGGGGDGDTQTETDTDTGSDSDTPARLQEPDSHRAEALACEQGITIPEPDTENVDESSECLQHADCTDGDGGRCLVSLYDDCEAGDYPCTNHCIYDECLSDEDCDNGGVCQCSAREGARCLSVGNCRTDADCGPHGFCSLSRISWGSGLDSPVGYFCRTSEDECLNDADCEDLHGYCDYDALLGHWACSEYECCIG